MLRSWPRHIFDVVGEQVLPICILFCEGWKIWTIGNNISISHVVFQNFSPRITFNVT